MPRADEQVLKHFREMTHSGTVNIQFAGYSQSQSALYYRECLRSNSYLKVLATAVGISVRTKKYREQLILAIDELLKRLPEREKAQEEVIERTFKPLPETSQQPVKLVLFRDIQVFNEQEVLDIIGEKSTALKKAVCVRIGIEEVLDGMEK